MKKVAIIDNYDSFTYNLVHYLEDLNCEVTVFRNDEFDLEEIEAYPNILLSPGPGIPSEAALLLKTIEKYAATKNILGICLGQQALAEFFGCKLKNLNQVHHGVSSEITVVVEDEILFKDLKKQLTVGRYHSWVVDNINFSENLEITSVDANGEIMSLRHKSLNLKAVQFHPESILTPDGKTILKNWVETLTLI